MKTVNIIMTEYELLACRNALNNVLHAIEMNDREFDARIGVSKEMAEATLDRLLEIDRKEFPVEQE